MLSTIALSKQKLESKNDLDDFNLMLMKNQAKYNVFFFMGTKVFVHLTNLDLPQISKKNTLWFIK